MPSNLRQTQILRKRKNCASRYGNICVTCDPARMFRIKHLRKTYPGGKLTLEQLAERSGVDRSSISRYENGKQWPSDEALAGIAAALNVTVAELFADYVPIPEDVLALARELEGTTPDELKAIVSMTRRFRQP